MSSGSRSARRLPARVYRRRRIAVAVVLVVVVAVIGLVVFPLSRGGADATSVATHTPGVTARHAASTPVTTPSAGATRSTTPAASPSAKTNRTPQPCSSGVVDVEAITDADSYAAGVQPKLSFSITNTSTTACSFDVGTDKQVFTVTSGTQTYWKSTDCQTDPKSLVVLLEPGKTLTSTPIPWDRTVSSPSTCSAQRAAVPAGGAAYHLSVSVGGVASQGYTQFLLY